MPPSHEDRQLAPTRKRVLPKGSYALIERLARQGAREAAIARQLGFSASTWARVKAKDEKAETAFQRGRDALEQELIAVLRNPNIPEGLSVQEGIALMRQRAHNATVLGNSLFHWRSDVQSTVTAAVQVQISPALTPEAYSAAIAARLGGSNGGS